MPRKYIDKHTRQKWRQTSAARHAEVKAKTEAYKASKGCSDCGWGPLSFDYHPAALDFDHLPGSNKRLAVSQMMTYSWAAIAEEIAKCDVVCARCHRIRTMRRHENGLHVNYGASRLEDKFTPQPQLFDV